MSTPRVERLRKIVASQPHEPQGWAALAHALCEAGDAGPALEAADRAVALAPDLAAAHASRAQALSRAARRPDALAAWQRALELDPREPRFHVGLASALLASGRPAQGCDAFERGVALSPDNPQLRRAAALFAMQCGVLDMARRHLCALADLADVPQAARDEARTGVLVIDEGVRITPALRLALSARDPERLREAVSLTPPQLLEPDEKLLERMLRMGQAAREPAPDPGWRWDEARASALAWPVIEAHFEEHRGDDVDRVLDSVRRVLRRASGADVGAPAARDRRTDDLVVVARAVHERGRMPWTGLDPIGWECRLRYFHALMNANHVDCRPGVFKPLPNKVRANPAEARGLPAQVVGTLRAFASRVRSAFSPGLVTAALWMYLLAKLHPFDDGNGGVGRLMASGDLVLAGRGPMIFPESLRLSMHAAVRRAHRFDELGDLVALVGEALAWRDRLLDEIERDPQAMRAAGLPVGTG